MCFGISFTLLFYANLYVIPIAEDCYFVEYLSKTHQSKGPIFRAPDATVKQHASLRRTLMKYM